MLDRERPETAQLHPVPPGQRGNDFAQDGVDDVLDVALIEVGVLRGVENIVNAILGEIIAALARGDRVELRGFGAFSVKHRPARTGRNPRTGAHVSVERKSVPFFKTGKEMRERLNRDD